MVGDKRGVASYPRICLQTDGSKGTRPTVPFGVDYDHWKSAGFVPSATQFIEAPALIPSHTTGVQILTQSAITCHTYPDNFFQVVIDSCLPIPDWMRIRNKIMASLVMKEDYSLYNTQWGWRGMGK